MKWNTREKAKVDRIACPWLITKFVDSDAESVFLPHDTNWSAITDGIVFAVPNAELGHHGEYCSFDAIIKRYRLGDDAAPELAKIVRAADTPKRDWGSEGASASMISTRRTASLACTTHSTHIARRSPRLEEHDHEPARTVSH
jgi:hypothetical protein